MIQQIWKKIGFICYWALMPLIRIYAANTKPRARVLIVHENSVLVVKNWLGAGGWALPGGGLEAGETPVEAAIREVKEELGFMIEPGALQDLGEYESREKGSLKTKYYLQALVVLEQPNITLRKHEIMEYDWLPITDLQQAEKGVSNTIKDSLGVWMSRSNLL